MGFRPAILIVLCSAAWAGGGLLRAVEAPAATAFQKQVRPVLEEYCYDCHGDGETRGGVALDAFNATTNFVDGRDVWWRVLKNLRAGLMPPAKNPSPRPPKSK